MCSVSRFTSSSSQTPAAGRYVTVRFRHWKWTVSSRLLAVTVWRRNFQHVVSVSRRRVKLPRRGAVCLGILTVDESNAVYSSTDQMQLLAPCNKSVSTSATNDLRLMSKIQARALGERRPRPRPIRSASGPESVSETRIRVRTPNANYF